jgi:hypothetical protein
VTPYDLKKYIVDNDKILFVLEAMGCHSFKEYGKEYRCALPNTTDSSKVAIKKDTLKTTIYGSIHANGDIFTLCMSIKGIEFYEANRYIHQILGLKFIWQKEEKKANPLDIFRNIRSRRKFNVKDIEFYDEDIITDFLPYLTQEWLKEGIMPYTRKEFNIGYSMKYQRILIPHRLWCGERNKYLGVMGRTTNEYWERLGIPKYLAIPKFSKGINLYGLHENYQHIQSAGIIFVAEAEKSVLKRHSLLDRTVAAMCGSTLTPEQVKILVGLNVDEIVLAFDKGIELEHILFECRKLTKFRKVSYIWDNEDILKDKESPMDCCDDVYKKLVNSRIQL